MGPKNYHCGCGKSFALASSLYTHIKVAHSRCRPPGTVFNKPGNEVITDALEAETTEKAGEGLTAPETEAFAAKSFDLPNWNTRGWHKFQTLASLLAAEGSANLWELLQDLGDHIALSLRVGAIQPDSLSPRTPIYISLGAFLRGVFSRSRGELAYLCLAFIRSLCSCLNEFGPAFFKNAKLFYKESDKGDFCSENDFEFVPLIFDFCLKKWMPRYFGRKDFGMKIAVAVFEALSEWLEETGLTKIAVVRG